MLKSLLKKNKNTNHEILQLAGSIDANDIREMTTVIEAGCENIDKNEW